MGEILQNFVSRDLIFGLGEILGYNAGYASY